jgi:hypothetical protein
MRTLHEALGLSRALRRSTVMAIIAEEGKANGVQPRRAPNLVDTLREHLE